MGRRCKNIVEVEEAPQRGVLLEVERECWGVLKTCWSQLQPYRQQDVEQVDAEMLESRLEQGGYVLALDIDGTMLTTDYDEADDVMCVNARSGLRELLVRVSAVQPLVTIGILTAAGERYASGARRLVSDLVSGFTADIFDFCISEQILKDLSVIHDSQERVLLVDNDPTAIKPETRRNTVIVPDFDYNPKGRDPVFLDVAAMMQELTDSRLPVATFLERCTKQGKYIYLHKGFYYMKRFCAECQETESPAMQLTLDSEFGTWDFFCAVCIENIVEDDDDDDDEDHGDTESCVNTDANTDAPSESSHSSESTPASHTTPPPQALPQKPAEGKTLMAEVKHKGGNGPHSPPQTGGGVQKFVSVKGEAATPAPAERGGGGVPKVQVAEEVKPDAKEKPQAALFVARKAKVVIAEPQQQQQQSRKGGKGKGSRGGGGGGGGGGKGAKSHMHGGKAGKAREEDWPSLGDLKRQR